MACALLVVAVMGVGTSLVEAGSPVPGTQADSVAEAPQAQVPIPAALPSSATGLSQVESKGEIAGSISASASCFAPAAQSSGMVTTTRTISYTYDPLGRLTSAAYSTGETYEYTYDAVGNRTAMTDTQGTHAYTYDTANRLTSVDGVAYTWDARGNLTGDGTFTYAYNGAGRLVRAESVTATLVYTYNAAGLRVAQSVDGDVTAFAWDWASGLPEMLAQPTSSQPTLYLVGHETLGAWDGSQWTYYLPDALGSVRQVADGTGAVVDAREWTPYGVEAGTAQAGLGYAGEWYDPNVMMVYLRARWYDGYLNQFVSPDTIVPDFHNPQSINRYAYVLGNPVNAVDPAGEYPVPLPRPGDVCPSPTASTIPPRSLMFYRSEYMLRRADGGIAYSPSPGVSEWWYCGEFKVTAYQFVNEADASGNSWYADAGGSDTTVSTVDGTTFSANDRFVQDVIDNGTGKPSAEICSDNYFHAPGDGNFYCGKGKPFDPTTDAYRAVAAHTSVLGTNAAIYIPGLEDHSDPSR